MYERRALFFITLPVVVYVLARVGTVNVYGTWLVHVVLPYECRFTPDFIAAFWTRSGPAQVLPVCTYL